MQFDVFYDAFYYASRPQGGADITSVTAGLPDALRAQLVNFMCSVKVNSEHREERLLFCPPLKRFCKIFICRDITRPRDFFFHTVFVNDQAFSALPTERNERFLSQFAVLLAAQSDQAGQQKPERLPVERQQYQTVDPLQIGKTVGNDPLRLAKFISVAFRPLLSGGAAVRFRLPDAPVDRPMHSTAADAAVFVLSLMPEAFLPAARMRFSADAQTAENNFDCNYNFLSTATPADYDFTAPATITEAEDPLGLFTALGKYISANGIVAYRDKILPVIQAWALACKTKKRISAELLYLMLRAKKELQLPVRQVSESVPAEYFSAMDAAWFDAGAPCLLSTMLSMSSEPVVSALEANALFNRPASQLPADGMDGFFLMYAAANAKNNYAVKERRLSALYNRYAGDERGHQLLHNVKKGMNLTLQLPSRPTPENVFEGVRSLERSTPAYAEQVAVAAVDGYVKSKNAMWIRCLHSMWENPATNDAVTAVLESRCEELLSCAQDRETIILLCLMCKNRPTADLDFRGRLIGILQNKKISYEELVHCVSVMGLREADLPKLPKPEPLGKQVDTLEKLANVSVPVSATDAASVRVAILLRLCELLEKDCAWQDFYAYLPVILRLAKFKPTNPLQPKIEKLISRQLAVLATDILSLQDGQREYVAFLVGLRKEFCLCLYPTTGAAAGKFDEENATLTAFKKTVLRLLPLLPLCLVTVLTVLLLFVLLPVVPATAAVQTVLPAVFAIAAVIMILVQMLLLRRYKTADYILPAAVVMLSMALIRLFC